MALRNKYNLNFQTMNFGDCNLLMPVGYIETVPGDSISGTITVNSLSQPVSRIMRTRMYFDLFAFYVPFRLLWEDWPEFISDRNATLTIPTVTDTFNQNFEKWFALTSTTNLAWLRRAYNMIYQTKFSLKGEINSDGSSDGSTDWHGNSLLECFNRPSTFDSSPVQTRDNVDGETITSPTTTLELREAFAKDNWSRMREFYGPRYVDYLAAMGIKADQGITEDAELIGMKHGEWKFRQVTDTTSAGLADSAGYYDSTESIQLKGRKYCQEHGLIAVFAVHRGEPIRTNGIQHPVLVKDDPTDYWTPEQESVGVKGWPTRVFDRGGVVTEEDKYYTPKFEDLRKGLNIAAEPDTGYGVLGADSLFGMWTDDSGSVNNYQQIASDEYNNFFANDQNYKTFQLTAQFRMTRNSPIRKHGQSSPIR